MCALVQPELLLWSRNEFSEVLMSVLWEKSDWIATMVSSGLKSGWITTLSFPFHPASYFIFVSFQVFLWYSYEISEYLTSYESLLIQTRLTECAIPFSHMHNQSPEHVSPNLHQNSGSELRRKPEPMPSAPAPPPHQCASKSAHLTLCFPF